MSVQDFTVWLAVEVHNLQHHNMESNEHIEADTVYTHAWMHIPTHQCLFC